MEMNNQELYKTDWASIALNLRVYPMLDFSFNEEIMSEFLRDHPSALEAFILYDTKNHRSEDKFYDNLCKLIGKNQISREDFKIIYEKMTSQNPKDAKKKILGLNDPATIRLCILYEVKINREFRVCCRNINRFFGPKYYEEFKCWFKRFSSGCRDLEEPIIIENGQRTFSDLPIHIVAKIVGKTSFFQQLKLRNVSHGLREIVDQERPSICKIEFEQGDITYKDIHERNDRYQIHFKKSKRISDKKRISQLSMAMKNPKLQLNQITYENQFSNKFNQMLKDLLASFPSGLSVEAMEIKGSEEMAINFFRAAKPGTLKKLVLDIEENSVNMNIDRFVEMEQWKELKEFESEKSIKLSHHFYHFNSLDVTVDEISIDDLVAFKETASKNPNFKQVILNCRFKPSDEEIEVQLGLTRCPYQTLRNLVANFIIPNSTELLIIETRWDSVTISRCTEKKCCSNNPGHRFHF